MLTISRRHFIGTLSAATLALRLNAEPSAANTLFLGNGGNEGIFSASWNAATGDLGPLQLAAACPQPGFLALGPQGRIYAVGDANTPKGAVFAFERKGAKLTALNQISSGGTDPCHIALSGPFSSQGWAFVANYDSGQVLATRIQPDGKLLEMGTAENFNEHSGPTTRREQVSHTHWSTVAPNGRFVYINDLGRDRIWLHQFHPQNGLTLRAEQSFVATPGSGPRTLHFHPHLPLAYSVNEVDSTVELLAWNAETGGLTSVERYNLVPEDYTGPSAGCDLVIPQDARHLYAINRFDNFVATYAVHPKTGRLSLLERADCGGKKPRHLALDPTERWLLIANQDSGNIAILPRNSATGRLGKILQDIKTASPMCLLFV